LWWWQDDLTPLHCAARNGHESVITALLDQRASVNARSKNHLTPLHMSAQGDHVDCASVLLQRGAAIDAGTRVRSTPRTCSNSGTSTNRQHLNVLMTSASLSVVAR